MLVLTANQQRQTTEGSVYHPENSKIYFAPTTHKATESSEHTALEKNEPTAWQALFTIGYFSLELITMHADPITPSWCSKHEYNSYLPESHLLRPSEH